MEDPKYKSFYRRHLPHIHPPQAQYFVTFRLANSLPKIVVEKLKSEYQELISIVKTDDTYLKYKRFQQYLNVFDQLLNSSHHGSLWLQESEIADIVAKSIRYHDGVSFDLISYTIMPNHVHILFDHSFAKKHQPINAILESIKKYSARRANVILHRTGKRFWQNESYDHVVRNDRESENVIRYILFNPVKAGLCKEWNDWKWTYLKEEYKKVFK